MSSALEVAAIGMQAQQRALDTIASNVANINTPAFKRSQLRFSELIASPAIAESSGTSAQADAIAGVGQWSAPMLDAQGQLRSTGNQLDLAIDGPGFVELMGPSGKSLLWRGGTLRILNDGTLATADGIALRAGISVPADATSLRIDREGKVFATTSDTGTEAQLGSIGLVKVLDASAVDRLDGGIYAAHDELAVSFAAAGEDGLGYFAQGSLEQSNVDLNTEMVDLVVSQRAYGANAQVIRAADELLSLANNLRR